MPDNEAPAPARPTLTQRRTAGPTPTSIPKLNPIAKPEPANTPAPSMERPLRMAPPGPARVGGAGAPPVNGAAMMPEEEKGSPAKIVLWVVLVVAIAVASYFAIRNNLGDSGEVEITPTPTETPVVTEVPGLISDTVLPDSEAGNPLPAAAFSATLQKVGTADDTLYSIDNFSGVKYTTFTRFMFVLSSEDDAALSSVPEVTATYDLTTKTISLTFANTSTAEGLIELEDSIPVDSETVSMIMRTAAPVLENDLYKIVLKQDSTYALHVVSTDNPTVVLDVKEVPMVVPTTTPETTVTLTPTVTPSVTVTLTPTPVVGGNILENSYSQAAQTLSNGLTTNSADMVCKDRCFYWIETAGGFLFDKPVEKGDGNRYPSVSAKLEGTKLTVTVNNLVTKSATSSMSFSGSKLVNTLDAVRAGNSLTYVFDLKTAKDYRILYTQSSYIGDADVLRIQVKP